MLEKDEVNEDPSWRSIARDISATTGRGFKPSLLTRIGGGCINSAFALGDGESTYFVKRNHIDCKERFASEMAGLQLLNEVDAVRVPKPITAGELSTGAFLVTEYISLSRLSREGERALGKRLARLHTSTTEHYGWMQDDAIGESIQLNAWCEDWVQFWCEYRLGYQLKLSKCRGLPTPLVDQGERLISQAADFFPGYRPIPSLLHGDLWCGNAAGDRRGNPVIYDPAVYYGDRETDIAMTELFGGFGRDFYDAYQQAWPLDPGYAVRKHLYNLYHILNHFNMFGQSYVRQAESILNRLLGEL